ncbi:hypothetical protein [Pseudoxanthomonas mexicana]
MKRATAPGFPLPFSADDACRHALAAFHRARRDATPPDQSQAVAGGEAAASWATPLDFLDTFFDYLTARVRAQAADAGVLADEDAQHARETLARWEHTTPADAAATEAAERSRLKANRMHEVSP